jgi:hypothetical protein
MKKRKEDYLKEGNIWKTAEKVWNKFTPKEPD